MAFLFEPIANPYFPSPSEVHRTEQTGEGARRAGEVENEVQEDKA